MPLSDVSPHIAFRAGLAVLRGVPIDHAPSWMQYDPRLDALVAAGSRYPELREWALAHNISESIAAGTDAAGAFDAPLLDPRIPREAQQEAVTRWVAAGGVAPWCCRLALKDAGISDGDSSHWNECLSLSPRGRWSPVVHPACGCVWRGTWGHSTAMKRKCVR
jgi:hypothetical protein